MVRSYGLSEEPKSAPRQKERPPLSRGVRRPNHLKRLAKNIVPTFQEAVINQSKPFTDTMHSRFSNKQAKNTRHYANMHKRPTSSPTSQQSYPMTQAPCPANFPLNFEQPSRWASFVQPESQATSYRQAALSRG